MSAAPTTLGARPADSGVLDVVAVPAGHPYVEHLLPLAPAVPRVAHRPDPDPDDPSRPARGRWWPPVALDPAWFARQDCDVLHLHFGFDDRPPSDLAALLDVAARRGCPVVLTVHDLRSPHQEGRGTLDAQLDVLVPRVDALVTLTGQAADEVERRWGRRPTVLAHPHIVDLDVMARLRGRRRAAAPAAPVVGVAVKSLRPNTDPLAVLPAVQRAVTGHHDAVLRINVHHDVRTQDAPRARRLVRWLDDAATRERVEVVWHDEMSDAELWAYLAKLHVAVLPYRFGTHSGWAEACHDVGTRVLAPAHGCYAGQGADGVFATREGAAGDGWADPASLEAEVTRLLAADPTDLVGLEPQARARQRTDLAAAHDRIYRDLLARRHRGTGTPR